jgi:hypothetical protein
MGLVANSASNSWTMPDGSQANYLLGASAPTSSAVALEFVENGRTFQQVSTTTNLPYLCRRNSAPFSFNCCIQSQLFQTNTKASTSRQHQVECNRPTLPQLRFNSFFLLYADQSLFRVARFQKYQSSRHTNFKYANFSYSNFQ